METLLGIFGGLIGLVFMVVFVAAAVAIPFAVVYYGIQGLVWLHGLGPPQIPVPQKWREEQAAMFKRDEKPNRKKAAVEQDELLEEVLGGEGPVGVDHIYLEDAPPVVTL